MASDVLSTNVTRRSVEFEADTTPSPKERGLVKSHAEGHPNPIGWAQVDATVQPHRSAGREFRRAFIGFRVEHLRLWQRLTSDEAEHFDFFHDEMRLAVYVEYRLTRSGVEFDAISDLQIHL